MARVWKVVIKGYMSGAIRKHKGELKKFMARVRKVVIKGYMSGAIREHQGDLNKLMTG